MPKQTKASRFVFRIMITPHAKETLDSVNEKIGITHIALASRLITWFADQPDEVKAGILAGFTDLGVKDPTISMLERMAAKK